MASQARRRRGVRLPAWLRPHQFFILYVLGVLGFLALMTWAESQGLSRHWIGPIFLFLTVMVYAGIGVYGRTSDSDEYYVAGRRIPPMYNGMAAAADWMSAASFISLSGALYIVFGKRAGHLHAGQSVSLGLLVAALVVVPVGVAHAGAALLSPSVLLVGVAVAAISSALPISLEMMALKRLPKEAFGIMISMEPAVAALLALALLGERLDTVQWLAIGCIVAASMGSAATARRLPAVQAQPA